MCERLCVVTLMYTIEVSYVSLCAEVSEGRE